jgi:hypothetical protein
MLRACRSILFIAFFAYLGFFRASQILGEHTKWPWIEGAFGAVLGLCVELLIREFGLSRFHFSLWALFVATTLIAVLLGLLAMPG